MFEKYGKARTKTDTGSAESQIALFTHRINHISEHLQNNKKDHSAETSLVRLVGKRRSLLDYLMKTDVFRYRAIIKELEIRK
ncbi:MAG: 30S ribosomal protein S15 [Bacteroidia bacterium]